VELYEKKNGFPKNMTPNCVAIVKENENYLFATKDSFVCSFFE
jgi:hypothetical protein